MATVPSPTKDAPATYRIEEEHDEQREPYEEQDQAADVLQAHEATPFSNGAR